MKSAIKAADFSIKHFNIKAPPDMILEKYRTRGINRDAACPGIPGLFLYSADIDALDEVLLQEGVKDHKGQKPI